MKKSEAIVRHEFVENLIKVADEAGIEYEIFEGVLMDSYIFYDAKAIKISGTRRTKYIIIKVEYVNEYSSEPHLIITDSKKTVEHYEKIFRA